MGAMAGDDLKAYVEKLGWTLNADTGVVSVPPNPDNQIESTVVQENIELSRASPHHLFSRTRSHIFSAAPELTKVIAHAAQTSLPVVPAV